MYCSNRLLLLNYLLASLKNKLKLCVCVGGSFGVRMRGKLFKRYF